MGSSSPARVLATTSSPDPTDACMQGASPFVVSISHMDEPLLRLTRAVERQFAQMRRACAVHTGLNVEFLSGVRLTGLVEAGDAARVAKSITWNDTSLELDGDKASPGNDQFYGTNSSGTKGWYPTSTIGDLKALHVTVAASVITNSGAVTVDTYTSALTLPSGAIITGVRAIADAAITGISTLTFAMGAASLGDILDDVAFNSGGAINLDGGPAQDADLPGTSSLSLRATSTGGNLEDLGGATTFTFIVTYYAGTADGAFT